MIKSFFSYCFHFLALALIFFIFCSYARSYFFSLNMWNLTSPPQVTCRNLENSTLKKHVPCFCKSCTFHENFKIYWLKKKLRILQGNFKPEFKPINENLQKGYTKGSVNNKHMQTFVPLLDENFSVKNAPKLTTNNLEDKICKVKKRTKHWSYPEDVYNHLESF